jgi:1,4-dihydroxy-2-naphthoate polyprenyltransferase
MMTRETLKSWIQASRPPFFIATFIPLAAGWSLAGQQGQWHPWLMLLVTLGAFMMHLATNLADDYFDQLQGTDAGESIGGSRVIQEGKITPRQILAAMIVLYIFSILIALYIVIGLKYWGLVTFIALAWFSSFFYVAPPVRYGYHGLGELSVGINMGPIMVVGTYWVIAGHVAWEPFFVSIPIGFMVAVILYYQSLPDMETDRAAHKHTLAVRFGKRYAYYALITFWGLIYLSIAALILTGYLFWPASFSVVTIPVLIKLLRIIKKTAEWSHLDRYGSYIRIMYFLNGVFILASLF